MTHAASGQSRSERSSGQFPDRFTLGQDGCIHMRCMDRERLSRRPTETTRTTSLCRSSGQARDGSLTRIGPINAPTAGMCAGSRGRRQRSVITVKGLGLRGRGCATCSLGARPGSQAGVRAALSGSDDLAVQVQQPRDLVPARGVRVPGRDRLEPGRPDQRPAGRERAPAVPDRRAERLPGPGNAAAKHRAGGHRGQPRRVRTPPTATGPGCSTCRHDDHQPDSEQRRGVLRHEAFRAGHSQHARSGG